MEPSVAINTNNALFDEIIIGNRKTGQGVNGKCFLAMVLLSSLKKSEVSNPYYFSNEDR